MRRRFEIRGWVAVTALLAIGLTAPPPSHAGLVGAPVQEAGSGSTLSDAELDNLMAQVAGELRCPVCRNQSVIESSAELSREMQSLIRERLAAGDTPEQVKEYFVARYGEWILLKPEARGVNLLVYVLPILTFLLGGLLVWRLLRRWSGGSAGRLAAAAADGTAVPGGGSPLVDEPSRGDAGVGEPADDAPALSDRDEAWLERAVSEG